MPHLDEENNKIILKNLKKKEKTLISGERD